MCSFVRTVKLSYVYFLLFYHYFPRLFILVAKNQGETREKMKFSDHGNERTPMMKHGEQKSYEGQNIGQNSHLCQTILNSNNSDPNVFVPYSLLLNYYASKNKFK